MSRVVLIADSETGKLVDVAGNNREGGRYAKFAKRMLSSDTNPVLDYGLNGGDTLNVSRNGGRGEKIRLDARTVEITGDVTIGGKSIQEIAAGMDVDAVIGRIKGKAGEVLVTKTPDPEDSTKQIIVISLDSQIPGSIMSLSQQVGNLISANYVRKSEIASVVDGISFSGLEDLDEVKQMLRIFINRLATIAGVEPPDDGGEEDQGGEE